MVKIFEGNDEDTLIHFLETLDVGEMVKKEETKRTRKGGILDWVEE